MPSNALRTFERLSAPRLLTTLLGVLVIGCTVVATEPPATGPTWDGGATGQDSGGGSSGGGGFPVVDASACQPGSVSTYQPSTYHGPSALGQGVCVPFVTVADPIETFYDQCLGPNASTDACASFRQQNEACATCLLTPQSATYYGPLIDFGTYVTANVAGCIQVAPQVDGVADPSALACAKSVQALAGCENAACTANCAVYDSASLASYQACASASEQSGCEAWASAASCANAEQDAGGVASACLGDFESFYHAIAPLFCGAPLEAGVVVPAKDAAAE